MRLIDTSTLKLEEFFDSNTPEYVILSHTWGTNEISFQDFQNGALNDKIRNCCRQAEEDGFQYVWIDTCCIDKTSSAELSEAINSMYRWYQCSSACYAFLDDYRDLQATCRWWERTREDRKSLIQQLGSCRWFTRGWTLQELIAPSYVKFYDAGWSYFGTRMSLQEVLSTITKIPRPLLNGSKRLQSYNVAVRMSWASKRTTTRLEDEAYCLMGLFEINMPMLYGEGRRAFQRLQEEIIKRHEDYSLFAWMPANPSTELSFLATRSSDFEEDRLENFRFEDLVNLTGRKIGEADNINVSTGPTIRSRGLSITLPLFLYPGWRTRRLGWAAICAIKGEPLKWFCLPIEQINQTYHFFTRRIEHPRDYLIPHESYRGLEKPCTNISKFVHTNINLAISILLPAIPCRGFNLKLRTPPEATMQTCSLKLLEIFASGVNEIRNGATYYAADELILLFQYANERSEMITGGLIVGTCNTTPWCNFLRRTCQADINTIQESQGHSRLMKALFISTYGAENPAMTRDLCRMRIGNAKRYAYLAARVFRSGGGLQLEIALNSSGTIDNHDEIGVLDGNIRLHRKSEGIGWIGKDKVVESEEEPSTRGQMVDQ